MVECVHNEYRHHIGNHEEMMAMKAKHRVLATYNYEPTAIQQGYNNRSLYISVGGDYDTSKQDPLIAKAAGENGVVIGEKAVTDFMKEKFTGGKGFDLYHLWKAVRDDSDWNDPETISWSLPGLWPASPNTRAPANPWFAVYPPPPVCPSTAMWAATSAPI